MRDGGDAGRADEPRGAGEIEQAAAQGAAGGAACWLADLPAVWRRRVRRPGRRAGGGRDGGGPDGRVGGAGHAGAGGGRGGGGGRRAAWTHVRAVLGTLEREVAEMEAVRQRLPREFNALMA